MGARDEEKPTRMRRSLERLYASALYLAAACLVLIALLVGAQVIGRIVDALLKAFGFPPYGFLVASLAEIAGYLLAAASFLALAATLKRGAHIRVTMLLGNITQGARFAFEVWALAAAVVFVAFISVNLAWLAYDSFRFNEVSYGLLPVPLAIPQAVMALGAATLLIALLDELQLTWRNGRPSFRGGEELVAPAQEP
jgi:TRAP-type C4-dicarboxylate transport system permease small subunit